MAFCEKRLVPVQFGGGVNTKADPKQLQAGELLSLTNAQFTKTGLLSKRYGFDALSNQIEGGGTITSGIELAVYKNELVLFDGTSVYSYLSATGNWANRGTAISIITEDKAIIRTSQAQQLNPDMAYSNGVEVYAWEDSRGGVRYAVLDTATKAFVVSDTAVGIAGASQPKCVTFGGLLYIFYTANTTLYYQIIGPLNPSVIAAPVAVVTDGYQGLNLFPYDVTPFVDSAGTARLGIAYYAWIGGGGSPTFWSVRMVHLTTSNVVSAPLVLVSHNGPITDPSANIVHGAINITVDSQAAAWVSWWDTTVIETARVTNYGTPSQTFSGTPTVETFSGTASAVVIAGIEDYTATTLRLFYEVSATHSYDEQTHFATIDASNHVSAVTTLRSVGLASKPWNYGGKIFLNTAYSSTLQATDFTWYVPATGSATIVAKETAGVGGGLQTNGMCPEIVRLSTGVYKFSNLQAGKLVSEANTLFSVLGVNSTKLTHSPTDNFLNAVQANTLLVVGGILQGYDGVSVTELGFHLYPENITVTEGMSGGNLSAGTYQYIVQFEWTDNNGQIYRSAPSVPVSITVPASVNVFVNGSSLRMTSKTKVSIVVYRTAVNGTIFRRVTSTLAPLLNDPTTDTWVFSDTLSDASQASNEINYTTGGVLANIAPPANSLITTYNNRVLLGGLSDKLLLWYSQNVVDNAGSNTVPPQFCQELTLACDPRGGDITALGLLNQAAVVFKASEIFVFSGNGPDATGNNNDFGDPQLISSDVGCINANTVVVTALGIMFESSRGIYLLDQSFNLNYIGAPVEDFNSLTLTASAENGADNQVVFVSAAGTALVYDYYHQQWSTWSNLPANDVVVYQDLLYFVRPDGHVFMQNRSSFTDAGVPIYMSFTLPNLNFAGIQGYQRVFKAFILGSYKGPHKLLVSVAYDYSDSYAQLATIVPNNLQETWGSNVAWGQGQGYGLPDVWGGTAQLYEWRIDFSQQKCTAIRLQISESQLVPYNEGYSISSIVFEVGALPGGNRLPAAQTFGAQ